MFLKIYIYLFLISIKASEDLFVPSKEWQEVFPGQAVPSGNILVRMDFETGKRYAKIYEDSDSNENLGVASLDTNDSKNVIESDITERKFRTLDEIKKEFDSLNITFDSEFVVVDKLLNLIKNKALALNERMAKLNELSELLHSSYNSERFILEGGLGVLLSFWENENLVETCAPTSRALFAVLQNNPDAQKSFLTSDGFKCIHELLTKINQSKSKFHDCFQHVTSVFSAALRGCPNCFNDFYQFHPSILDQLLSIDDKAITSRLLSLLALLFKETKQNGPDSFKNFNQLIRTYFSCDTVDQPHYLSSTQDRENNDSSDDFLAILHSICQTQTLITAV